MTDAISISCVALISNIIRNRYLKVPDKHAAANSLEQNSRISSIPWLASHSVSLPRLDNPTGACPTHRRQWADFLVPQGTHTKVLQIVFRDADMTCGVLQTWKDTDHHGCQLRHG